MEMPLTLAVILASTNPAPHNLEVSFTQKSTASFLSILKPDAFRSSAAIFERALVFKTRPYVLSTNCPNIDS